MPCHLYAKIDKINRRNTQYNSENSYTLGLVNAIKDGVGRAFTVSPGVRSRPTSDL